MLKIGTLCWVTKAEGMYTHLIGCIATIKGPPAGTSDRGYVYYPASFSGSNPKPPFAERVALLPFSDPDISQPEFVADVLHVVRPKRKPVKA